MQGLTGEQRALPGGSGAPSGAAPSSRSRECGLCPEVPPSKCSNGWVLGPSQPASHARLLAALNVSGCQGPRASQEELGVSSGLTGTDRPGRGTGNGAVVTRATGGAFREPPHPTSMVHVTRCGHVTDTDVRTWFGPPTHTSGALFLLPDAHSSPRAQWAGAGGRGSLPGAPARHTLPPP